MKTWFSLGLTVAILIYAFLVWFYQPPPMGFVLPVLLAVSLVLVHVHARTGRTGIGATFGISLVPLVAASGLAARTGLSTVGSVTWIAAFLLAGIALFAGLFLTLRSSQG